MVLHTGERWAQEAGDIPDKSWCPICKEWVIPDWDVDENHRQLEWCPSCDNDKFFDEEKEGWYCPGCEEYKENYEVTNEETCVHCKGECIA